MATEVYYMGGGDVWLVPLNLDGSEGTPIEIGCMQEATIKVETNLTDIVCHTGPVKITKDKVVTEKKAVINFKTSNVNTENLAKAFGGTKVTKNYSAGDTLPDGTTAAEDISIDTIEVEDKGGLFKGKVKFIGSPATGNIKPVHEILYAVVQSDSELALISDSQAEISFTAEALGVTENGKTYLMRSYFLPFSE